MVDQGIQRLLDVGRLAEAEAQLQALAARAGAVLDDPARTEPEAIEVCIQYADLLRRRDERDRAIGILGAVVSRAEAGAFFGPASNACRLLAFMKHQLNEREEARKLAFRALSLARRSPPQELAWRLADSCAMVAHTFEPRGQYRVAQAWFSDAATWARKAEHQYRLVTVLSDQGRIHAVLGEYGTATERLHEGLQVLRGLLPDEDASRVRSTIFLRLATVAISMEDFEEGGRLLDQIVIDWQGRDESLELDAVARLADLHLRRGEPLAALEVARRATARADAARLRRTADFSRMLELEALLELQQHDEAVRLFGVLARMPEVQSPQQLDLDLLRTFLTRASAVAESCGRPALSRSYRAIAADLAALERDEGVYRTAEHQRALHAIVLDAKAVSEKMLKPGVQA